MLLVVQVFEALDSLHSVFLSHPLNEPKSIVQTNFRCSLHHFVTKMSLLQLPAELLTQIIQDLSLQDLNALVQCHPALYYSLNGYLYARGVTHNEGSALWWAADRGSLGTLQRLVDAGADVCWKSNYWSRTGAFPRAKHLRYLKLCDGPIPLARHPISNAAKQGHTSVVAMFLDYGVDVNHKSRFGRSPLALAAGGGHFDTVKMLLSRGASLLSVDLDCRRPITYAAREGHNEITDYLLDQFRSKFPRLKLTAKDDIQIMLQHAARRGDETRVVHLLFKEGAQINFQFTVESRTPLCDAVHSAPVSMVRLLLENGSDPNARESPGKLGDSRRGWTPLKLAIDREDSYEVIQLLLEYGADAAADSDVTLEAAARARKSDEFHLLVEFGADIENPQIQNPLMRAARRSNCEPIVRSLLQRGAKPNPPAKICRRPVYRSPEPGSMKALEDQVHRELINAVFAKRYWSDT